MGGGGLGIYIREAFKIRLPRVSYKSPVNKVAINYLNETRQWEEPYKKAFERSCAIQRHTHTHTHTQNGSVNYVVIITNEVSLKCSNHSN